MRKSDTLAMASIICAIAETPVYVLFRFYGLPLLRLVLPFAIIVLGIACAFESYIIGRSRVVAKGGARLFIAGLIMNGAWACAIVLDLYIIAQRPILA